MLNNQDEVTSVEPLCDRPHPRTVAREAVQRYQAMRNMFQPEARRLSQSDIDGIGERSTVNFTRRATKFHRASLLRRIRNLF